MKSIYATAVLTLLKDGQPAAEVLSRLRTVLDRRGHNRLFGPVVREVERQASRALRPAAQLFVASEAGTKQHQEAIKVAKATLDAPDPVPVVVDETLIGGFILEANGQRLNHSYHEQLRRLYQKISG